MSRKPREVWSKDHEKYVIKNYGVLSNDELEKHLDRDMKNITSKASYLRKRGHEIKRMKKAARRWTIEEEEFIKDNLEMNIQVLAKKLNRSRDVTYIKMRELRVLYEPIEKKEIMTESKIERQKKEDAAYLRLINEPVIAGLNLEDVRLDKSKEYKVKLRLAGRGNNRKKNNDIYFQGKLIAENKTNVTLKNKYGKIETFIKADILTEEYLFEEAK